jgi:uncharacterized protein YqeY
MTIQEKINIDLKNAMLNKDNSKRDLLRVVIGEINRIDKNLHDEQVIKIIKKMFENAVELGNVIEQDILNSYLPKMLTIDELTTIINDFIKVNNLTSVKETGKVMQFLKQNHNSLFDGKDVNNILKLILK